MIEVRSPGKLFIAGEYAVVEPGHLSVLVAVDRAVTVVLRPASDHGRIISDQYGRLPVVWRRQVGGIVLEHDQRPFDYVLAAIDIVEKLATELGVELSFYELSISSELDDVNGRKFGLGSSGAVTAATVRALDQHYHLGLSRTELFKLALLATASVNAHASGGDVAASMFGGWIAYSAPDRLALLERMETVGIAALLTEEWPGLSLRRLSPPSQLRLVVGWTGEPASTARLLDELQDRKWRQESHYAEFLQHSQDCVARLVDALQADDAPGTLAAIREARALLARLSEEAGIVIETPALAELCAAAEEIGAAAKSSGAGGGDCGIVLAGVDADLSGMLRRWEMNDIRNLTLRIHPPEGSIDVR